MRKEYELYKLPLEKPISEYLEMSESEFKNHIRNPKFKGKRIVGIENLPDREIIKLSDEEMNSYNKPLNKALIDAFNEKYKKGNSFSNKYKCFDFKKEKSELDNMMEKGDTQELLNKHKKDIEVFLNYPECLKEKPEKNYVVSSPSTKEIMQALFCKINLEGFNIDADIDLSQDLLTPGTLLTYTHTNEIYKYYKYVIGLIEQQDESKNFKLKKFDCTLTNEQLDRIFDLVQDIKLFKEPFELHDLKKILNNSTTRNYHITNNQNLACLFNYLQPVFITEKWQSVIENNKCLIGSKGQYITGKNLSVTLANVNLNSNVSKKIKGAISKL